MINRYLFLLSFAVLFAFLPPPDSFAQGFGTLRGKISDAENGETLAYSNVLIQELETGASADVNGIFLITGIPAGKTYTVKISYVGYQTQELEVEILDGELTHINVELEPSGIELQTVEKIGQRMSETNATDLGLERITVRELEMLPKGVETDIFRSLHSLPSVQSTGDVSARYFVRGGRANENLVLFEDTPIYNPFHAFGMFSTVDPDMIKNVEFYQGGFSAEYGGRLSSVLEFVTKDGNKNQYGGSFNISQLTAKALVEGPIPDGSFIVSARRSHSSDILKKFLNNQTAPITFYDASFKVNYSNPDFGDISKITLHGFVSDDKLKSDDLFAEDFSWSNKLVGFKWFQAAEDAPLFFEIGVNYSTFEGKVEPKLSSAKAKDNSVNDLSLKMDFSYVFPSNDEIAVGLHVQDIQVDLFLENSFGAISDVGSEGTAISFYGKYKFMQWETFGMDIGARVNLARMSNNTEGATPVEPRVSLTWRPYPFIAFKGSWGIYQQELTTLSDETELISLFEPWLISPDYMRPSTSLHYIFGVETQFWEELKFDVEGYYKYSTGLPTVNQEKFYNDDPDFISGQGESYGWEFTLKYTKDPISFTGSYSLRWAYKEVDGWLYYPRFDSRHGVNLTTEINFGSGWNASIVWFYNSGLPYTEALGYYDKFFFGNLYNDWYIYDSYDPYAIYRDINLGRLPDYHRMDITVSKEFTIDPLKFSISGSIINVYDRRNLFYFKRDTGERVDMLPFLPTATLRVEL